MKKPSRRIVFFGNERIATGVTTTAPTLQKLVAAGYDVVAVVANNSNSTSGKQRDLEIATVAQRHNIPLFLPAKLSDIKDKLKELRADIGVLVAYGKMVPQSIIDIFPKGIINIHPSLLPLHRGPTPLESVILHGDAMTGVSVMDLVKDMDAGPVYAQTRVALSGTESKQELADKLLQQGSDMLLAVLPKVLEDTTKPVAQEHARATYDALISKDDSRINWDKSAERLVREIRAYKGWPKSTTTIASMPVIITSAHHIHSEGIPPAAQPGAFLARGKELVAICNPGFLIVDSLIPAGKKEMTGQAFLAGYKRLLTKR